MVRKMEMQDIIDMAIENLETTYGIIIDRPIGWRYNYNDAQQRMDEIIYNFKALEWISTSDTDSGDGIIMTIGMKNVEYKIEDLKYEIWLLLKQTEYQMAEYEIKPEYKEDICELTIIKKDGDY